MKKSILFVAGTLLTLSIFSSCKKNSDQEIIPVFEDRDCKVISETNVVDTTKAVYDYQGNPFPTLRTYYNAKGEKTSADLYQLGENYIKVVNSDNLLQTKFSYKTNGDKIVAFYQTNSQGSFYRSATVTFEYDTEGYLSKSTEEIYARDCFSGCVTLEDRKFVKEFTYTNGNQTGIKTTSWQNNVESGTTYTEMEYDIRLPNKSELLVPIGIKNKNLIKTVTQKDGNGKVLSNNSYAYEMDKYGYKTKTFINGKLSYTYEYECKN